MPVTTTKPAVGDPVPVRCRRRVASNVVPGPVPAGESEPESHLTELRNVTSLATDRQREHAALGEALGVQVRQAVELLVGAFGRIDVRDRERGGRGLQDVTAHEVYRGAVSVMMRIVFLLFAEERRLLPADNELYATAYSAGHLCAELEQRVAEGSEEALEHGTAAWQRLIALFNAVYYGIDHPRLTMPGHDGSLFDPDKTTWLPPEVDDRTVLHLLRAVRYVQAGRGAKSAKRRAVDFRSLDVEQIGYVYEGLLSFEGFRADGVTVGLIGKAGLEAEVPLADLEELADRYPETPALAEAIAGRYKDAKIGSAAAVARRLASSDGAGRAEARTKLLAVAGGDRPLSERLLPFHGIIRTDLRDLPVVVLPGALFVTESALRGNTGTHYTPRRLAEEIVEGALEPLVYDPGPLQSADPGQWRPRSAAQILDLKVADIAMGSAAFLIAAARYLGGHLLDAALREGQEWAATDRVRTETSGLGLDDDPAVVEARRQIIERCLYGVDINPMAVEVAKLSLWLVARDSRRPFTFLDDRLVAGDSLLGLGNTGCFSSDDIPHLCLERELQKAKELRAEITALPEDGATQDKRKALLDESRAVTRRAAQYADLVAGGQLAKVTKGQDPLVIDERIGAEVESMAGTGRAEAASGWAETWLALDLPAGAFARRPLHWPLEFPEVFDRGGFDAVIGNPPFLGGQKLTGALGVAYREYLVRHLGRGARGSADLIAYFVLRAHQLLRPAGQTGLIATNTLAQGDTREVGLDQIMADGVTLRAAVKSERWPSRSVAVEYCAVWTTPASVGPQGVRLLDGRPVSGITSSLDPVSRVSGVPHRLAANSGIAFKGSEVTAVDGFTMSSSEAGGLICADRRNADVLFPFINGEDLNSRPSFDAGRWIINFFDWSQERAAEYVDCYRRLEVRVKPVLAVHDNPRLRRFWWRYKRSAPALNSAIAGLSHVIVIALVSKTVIPVTVPNGQVFSHKLGVFATGDPAVLALLSSSPHYWWTASRSSTMKADINYSLSDVFNTFAMPDLTERIRSCGENLDRRRRAVALDRGAGLTAIYNLTFDVNCHDADVEEIRRLHREIDEAVFEAYGWGDLLHGGLDYGFHKAGAYTRYTVGPAVQREILDRLLELNHARYAEEVAGGLHGRSVKKAGGGVPAALVKGEGSGWS